VERKRNVVGKANTKGLRMVFLVETMDAVVSDSHMVRLVEKTVDVKRRNVGRNGNVKKKVNVGADRMERMAFGGRNGEFVAVEVMVALEGESKEDLEGEKKDEAVKEMVYAVGLRGGECDQEEEG
jgi:hypothetical protein